MSLLSGRSKDGLVAWRREGTSVFITVGANKY